MFSLGTDFVSELRDGVMSLGYAFVMVHILAYAYVYSHRAISMSIAFIRTMMLASIATAVMVLVVGRTLSWGFALFGALSMLAFLRFRVSLRDPRDIVFLFASLIIGLAAGTQTFGIGMVGTLGFSAAALYLNHLPLGQPTRFDAQLRFRLRSGNSDAVAKTQQLLDRGCASAVLAMMRPVSQGEASEYVYQVRFRRGESRSGLMDALGSVAGVSDLSLMMEDLSVEI
jgi:hypothetical protein